MSCRGESSEPFLSRDACLARWANRFSTLARSTRRRCAHITNNALSQRNAYGNFIMFGCRVVFLGLLPWLTFLFPSPLLQMLLLSLLLLLLSIMLLPLAIHLYQCYLH